MPHWRKSGYVTARGNSTRTWNGNANGHTNTSSRGTVGVVVPIPSGGQITVIGVTPGPTATPDPTGSTTTTTDPEAAKKAAEAEKKAAKKAAVSPG